MQIRTAVDARLATLWPQIQAKQDAYFAANGRFWQGRRSHLVTPSEGIETVCVIGIDVPTDQPDPWPLAIRTMTLPMSVQLDCYAGVLGVGYVATVQVRVLGVLYERSAQVGPEAWRVAPWHVATEA